MPCNNHVYEHVRELSCASGGVGAHQAQSAGVPRGRLRLRVQTTSKGMLKLLTPSVPATAPQTKFRQSPAP